MMSEKMCECKVCKQQIASSAKVCPHCGAKNKKKKPVWAIIIGAIVLVIVIGVASGGNEPVKVGDDFTQNNSTGSNDQDTKNTFGIGEVVELKDVQAVLVGVTESAGSSFNTPGDGNVYVLCEFEITNNSKEDVVVSSVLSFNAYCDDYVCAYSIGALLEKGDKNQLDGTVTAGKKIRGVIGYEVPENWEELEIQFTPDFWSGKEIVFTAKNK